MSTWFVDIESFSEVDLKKVGAYKYAEHPSTEIILLAIARGDEPVLLWDKRKIFGSTALTEDEQLIKEMVKDGGPIYAHNCGFEVPMFHFLFQVTFGYDPPTLERWRDTAAMCRRAAIPWKLRDAAKFLRVPTQKIDGGASLIKFFSIPTDKVPHATAWEEFGEYCKADVQCMREIYHQLKRSFSLDREPGFFFDLRLNHRGIPVNRSALNAANSMVKSAMETLTAEFRALTGLNPTQRDKVLTWLRERGYPAENLQSGTMEEILEDPPEGMWDDAYRALELRAGGSFAALAKIPTMLGSACEDDRIRGAFLWSGALRTHRWSGRLVQPQNFKRPTIKDTHLAYQVLKGGAPVEEVESIFGPVPEVLASCIRHFIELEGEQFLDGDFSNIEARITPWLCGQEDMLDEFRRGEDVYKKMASFIFNIPESRVDGNQRFIAKQATLACQFQVGWRKFKSTCQNFGHTVSKEICKTAVSKYREKRDKIVDAWELFNETAMAAIRKSGSVQSTCRVKFRFGLVGGFRALQMELPSGHKLTYPLARIMRVTKKFPSEVEGEFYERTMNEIQFWGKEKESVLWGWQSTYGGKLLENATQAVGGDFMSSGLLAAEAGGYECFATIHDQALCVYDPTCHSVEEFRALLCTVPDWAEGFPLEASCGLMPFYSKD